MRVRRGIRVEDKRHTLHRRCDMFERLQPLAAYGEFETGEAGEIAARAGEVWYEAIANWIGHLHEHNGWGIALAQSRHYGRPGRQDDVRGETDQFSCLAEQEAGVARRPAVLQAHVAPLHPAQLSQSGLKRLDAHFSFRVARRHCEQRTNHPQPIALLCACAERPAGCRAAEQRDELAPPHHSITSSARCCKNQGTSRPSALAVLRLMTSSNFEGCTTGKSAGFSPL